MPKFRKDETVYLYTLQGQIQKYAKETVIVPSLSGAKWAIVGKYPLATIKKMHQVSVYEQNKKLPELPPKSGRVS